MNGFDEAYGVAKNNLENLLPPGGYRWFGAIALVLTQELEISIGPLQVDYGDTPVLAGHYISIPMKNVDALPNMTTMHFEGFMLAKTILADMVLNGTELPYTLRALTSLFLTETIKPPKPPKQTNRNLPSHKSFSQQYAIWHTLAVLKDQFSLAPTNNGFVNEKTTWAKTSRQISGAEVVEKALAEVARAQSDESFRRATAVSIKSINAVWGKRKTFENIGPAVWKELENSEGKFQT